MALHALSIAWNCFFGLISTGPVSLFVSIPLHFFLALGVVNTGSRVGPQNKIGHPGHCYKRWIPAPVLSVRGM